MDKDEIEYFNQQEENYKNLQQRFNDSQVAQSQQALFMQENERSMVKDQLDLNEELDKLEHLLRGHILTKTNNDQMIWVAPSDPEMVILSDYGIHLIMNTIIFYINKNTLLSNYDETTILTKMEDFAETLADTVFMEYEKVFQYPSFDDCKKIMLARLEHKTNLRMFTMELMGKKPNRETIESNLIFEMENRIDSEIQKIKEQIIKNKLKRFMILIREVQDAVHSTYLRALNGQERKTLREHIHISESRGGFGMQQKQGGGFNPLSWFKR